VNTGVLVYDLDANRPHYVGLVNGQVVWVHGKDPWLRMQAEEAIAAAKNSP